MTQEFEDYKTVLVEWNNSDKEDESLHEALRQAIIEVLKKETDLSDDELYSTPWMEDEDLQQGDGKYIWDLIADIMEE